MILLAAVEFNLADHSESILRIFNKNKLKALEAVGLQAERHAKEKCPVVTGRLRNSISHTAQDNAAYIGTNVEYAPYVELGTGKRKPKHFLKNAAQNYSGEYKEILRRYMQSDS